MKNLALLQATYGLTFLLFFSCSSPKKTESAEIGTGIDFGNKSFNYYPPLPQNGKHKGVIVIGGSGLDAFIIEMDKQKNWKLKESEFGKSNIYENEIDMDYFDSLVANYVEKMLEYKISNEDIHFILSSTTAEKTEAVAMIRKSIDQFGFSINLINAEEEASYAFQAVMPDEYSNNSFVMDIGTGNTKISWIEGDLIKTFESFGSKYYLDGVTDSLVFEQVKDLSLKIPDLNAKNCFLIGGAPYELAKLSEEYTDRYTVLNKLNTYNPSEEKAKAGLNLLQAVSATNRTRSFIFDWESNFAIGYLLHLPY